MSLTSTVRSYRSPNPPHQPCLPLLHEISPAYSPSKPHYPQVIAELEPFPSQPRLLQNHHPSNFAYAELPLHILPTGRDLTEYQQCSTAVHTAIHGLGITLPTTLAAKLTERYTGATPLDQYVIEESCWVAVVYEMEV